MSGLIVYLLSRGFDAEVADIYGAFLHAAIQLLLEAHASLVAGKEWEAFASCDGSLGQVKKRGKHKQFKIPDEVAITQELEKRMRDIYGINPERWPALVRHHPNFDVERSILTGRKRGKKTRRSDMGIVSLRPRGPSLVIEAKVLEERSHVLARLLGPEGIECFRGHEAYAQSGRFGGLLAYTVHEEGAYWRTALAEAYAVYRACVGPLAPILVVPPGFDIQIVGVSRPDVSVNDIEMLNIVLRFERQLALP